MLWDAGAFDLEDAARPIRGFVAGYTKIHHDEHRHVAYGTWSLWEQVAAEVPS